MGGPQALEITLSPMHNKDQILLVDDDPELRRSMARYLARSGLRAMQASNGRQMQRALEKHAVDLVVLELALPDADGLDLCRDLRATSNLPVLILSTRGTESERILGIEMGADDYLVKPISPRELLARIKGILRRARALPHKMKPDAQRWLVFAGWKLDTATRLLTGPHGTTARLSDAEYKLLHAFLRHPKQVLGRHQLLELIHGREAATCDRAIDVQISRLRRRLHGDGSRATLIATIRGEGYVLITQVNGMSA